jgi:hypothetical protein
MVSEPRAGMVALFRRITADMENLIQELEPPGSPNLPEFHEERTQD